MNIKIIISIALLLTTACGETASPMHVQLNVKIRDDNSEPVPGVKVLVNNKSIGQSDAKGQVSTALQGKEGRSVSIEIKCPPGFKALLDSKQTIAIRYLRSLREPDQIAPMDKDFICAHTIHEHVLIVRTDNRKDIPIKLMGKAVAKTNDNGVAIWRIEGAPGEEILVTLDTSQQPQLRPASPYRRMLLPSKSRFMVFDQKFEEKKKHRHRSGRRKKTRGPRRL